MLLTWILFHCILSIYYKFKSIIFFLKKKHFLKFFKSSQVKNLYEKSYIEIDIIFQIVFFFYIFIFNFYIIFLELQVIHIDPSGTIIIFCDTKNRSA